MELKPIKEHQFQIKFTNDLDVVGYVHEGHPFRDHLFPNVMLDGVILLEQDDNSEIRQKSMVGRVVGMQGRTQRRTRFTIELLFLSSKI